MRIETKEYALECADDNTGAALSGSLRLASPAAYEEAFGPIKRALAVSTNFKLDLSSLNFMNSSGITGLSRIVLAARSGNKELTIVVNEQVAWQKKTITSLQKLYPKLKLLTRA